MSIAYSFTFLEISFEAATLLNSRKRLRCAQALSILRFAWRVRAPFHSAIRATQPFLPQLPPPTMFVGIPFVIWLIAIVLLPAACCIHPFLKARRHWQGQNP